MAHDSRVFVFDQDAKEENEGKGFIMPGWQASGAILEPKCAFCAAGTLAPVSYLLATCNLNLCLTCSLFFKYRDGGARRALILLKRQKCAKTRPFGEKVALFVCSPFCNASQRN